MFVDIATVKICAGDGGNGIVNFRHEKFIDMGGPDGGDGGDGGDVVFVASRNQNTLANFRYKKELKAEPGSAGSKRRKHGKNGKTLQVDVPVGTTISNEEGDVLCDFTEDGQTVVLAQGGKGGFGNAHFISSVRQAPRIAEKGEAGEQLTLSLELKMIADVGLVGLPNAGKSTLLSVISNARPEIADYPFTTLTPNLGVVDVGKQDSLLMADIPGLIAGASQGKGLGDEFLRHVERTRVLLHLIDVYNDDLKKAYKTIQAELRQYRVDLSKKPQIVALTKIDGLDDEIVAERIQELTKILPKKTAIFAISAKSNQGVQDLLHALVAITKKADRSKDLAQTPAIPVLKLGNELAWQVTKRSNGYHVTGHKIEKFASRTDFDSYHAVQRLRDIMQKTGIMHELRRRGISPGNKIHIGKHGSVEY